MTTNQCYFSTCPTPVEEGVFWCIEHLHAFRHGLLDDCPGCGFGKETCYSTCPECCPASTALHGEDKLPVGPAPQRFYVYVLQLEGGVFRAGSTSDLQVRLMEHRHGIVPPTAGRNPRLAWFTMVESPAAAESLKIELRRLCRDDPREMRRWVITFRDLVRDLNVR